MSRVLLILFYVFVLQNAWGQDSIFVDEEVPQETLDTAEENPHELIEPAALESTSHYQDEALSLREFDDGKWKAIVGDTDYTEAAQEPNNTQPFSLPWLAPLLKILGYVAVICLILFLLYYITNLITFSMRIERTRLQMEDLEQPVENIEALDIEALLAQARREGNFRMAIRLYYLGLLKKLNTLGMIAWKKDKTNHDYLSELFLKDFYYKEIQRLTVSYEAVWYGEHTLRGESLQRLTEEFENVYRHLHTAKTP